MSSIVAYTLYYIYILIIYRFSNAKYRGSFYEAIAPKLLGYENG